MSTNTAPRLRLDPDRFQAVMSEVGWPSTTAAARDLGVSHTTLHRALRGESSPGERLLAALLATIGEARFYGLIVNQEE